MSVENINRTIDIASKLSVPVGVAVMLFLQSQFVTRSEFSKSQERTDMRLTKIEEVLIRMEANAETDKRHDRQLADHEDRLRGLEKREHAAN